jgi:predicted nucleotidyltransferase
MADKVGQTGSHLMEKREIITKAIEKIKHHYNPHKIILFGSFAWGKPAKDSNIDFFIVKRLN